MMNTLISIVFSLIAAFLIRMVGVTILAWRHRRHDTTELEAETND